MAVSDQEMLDAIRAAIFARISGNNAVAEYQEASERVRFETCSLSDLREMEAEYQAKVNGSPEFFLGVYSGQ